MDSESKTNNSTTVPDWLPDWRDTTQYPNPIDATTDNWRWQFLRRNPEYQSFYAHLREWADAQKEKKESPPDYLFDTANYKFGLVGLPDPSQSSETAIPFHPIRFAEYSIILAVKIGHGNHGPCFIIGPEPSIPAEFRTVSQIKEWLSTCSQYLQGADEYEDTGHMFYSIDLGRPLDRQLESIRQSAEKKQQELIDSGEFSSEDIFGTRRNKVSGEQYIRFLRVFDAYLRGDTANIGETLYPDASDYDSQRKSVDYCLKKSKEIVYFGYRYMR